MELPTETGFYNFFRSNPDRFLTIFIGVSPQSFYVFIPNLKDEKDKSGNFYVLGENAFREFCDFQEVEKIIGPLKEEASDD
jgi:hypothetical protein